MNILSKFHPRIIGTPTPVFPGFEFDFERTVPDREKQDAIWHNERALAMVRAHPEIKELFGREPTTALWCIAFSAAQLGLAAAAYHMPVWAMIGVAFVFGSWINMNLFQLAHECNHATVFKDRNWNRWLFTITTLPMFFTGHHSWWIEHPVHHADLGSSRDFITRRRTFFLATRIVSPFVVPFAMLMLVLQVFRSIAGLVLYAFDLLRGHVTPSDTTLAVLGDEHLVNAYDRENIKLWAVWYPALCLAVFALLFLYGGWMSIIYLLLSASFMSGFLNPVMLGLILSNSHFHGHKEYQPSSSYYGWMNRITFNFGLHTEHHDFARIPWNRLHRLRQIAPEYYDDLIITKSYAGLAMKFIFGTREIQEQRFDNELHRNLKGPSSQSLS